VFGSPPVARIPRAAIEVAFGSFAPNDDQLPSGASAFASATRPRRMAGSLVGTPAAASACRARPVVSGSISVPDGMPAKFHAPFGCCAPFTWSMRTCGWVPPTRST
jgi:hypothetical protein